MNPAEAHSGRRAIAGEHRTLSKAPVVEALVDFRVDRSPTITLDGLRAAAEELASEFPAREELRVFSGEFGISPQGGSTVTAQPPSPAGYILRSADGKWAAQFRLDGFTLSRLEPYTSWADLTDRAKRLWARYASAAAPRGVARTASRFINRIPLPQGLSFDRTFSTSFGIAPSLPQAVAGFLLRFVIPFEEVQAVAIVTQALPENSQECTFDLDVFSIFNPPVHENTAWAKLEQLRTLKNRLFFESLTDEALERFQ